jgi:hypothetical protein
MRVQIRAEFYNVFNHANLERFETFGGRAGFENDIDGVASGVRVRYGGPPRQVVLAARIFF